MLKFDQFLSMWRAIGLHVAITKEHAGNTAECIEVLAALVASLCYRLDNVERTAMLAMF